MGLELGMEFVFACFFLVKTLARMRRGTRLEKIRSYRLVPLKQNNPTAFVTSRQVVASMIELDG